MNKSNETQSQKIVVHIDDSPEIRKILSFSLNGGRNPRLDYHSLASGSEFFEKLKSGEIAEPDLIISDFQMPGGMSGFDIHSKLNAEMQHLIPRFRLLTGAVISGELGEHIEEKGIVIWSKPCNGIRNKVYEALGLEMPDN